MSLDFTLTRTQPVQVYDCNITHNLGAMAAAAGIYGCLWRPEENGIRTAEDMVGLLEAGIAWLETHEAEARAMEPENKWGTYDDFLKFCRNTLSACREYPDATVEASR